MNRSDLLLHLQARLQIEDAYKRHPEIEQERIHKPLVIIGQGRSGTSALQNLLSQDPNNGTTLHWECLFPYPPPERATYRTDSRIARAEPLISQLYRVVPEMISMHEFGAQLPIETIFLDALSFRSPDWFGFSNGQVPSYNAYVAVQDEAAILRVLRNRIERSGIPGTAALHERTPALGAPDPSL